MCYSPPPPPPPSLSPALTDLYRAHKHSYESDELLKAVQMISDLYKPSLI